MTSQISHALPIRLRILLLFPTLISLLGSAGPVWSISSPSASPPLASPSSGSPLGSAESGAVWPSAVAQTVPTAIITGKVLFPTLHEDLISLTYWCTMDWKNRALF